MGKAVTFFLGIIFGLLLSGLVITAIANIQTKKAYLVLSGQVLTDEGLEAYREKATPVAQRAGIKVIARNEQIRQSRRRPQQASRTRCRSATSNQR